MIRILSALLAVGLLSGCVTEHTLFLEREPGVFVKYHCEGRRHIVYDGVKHDIFYIDVREMCHGSSK